MFEKPASVFLAIVDGVQESGVKLESACAPVKECVAGTLQVPGGYPRVPSGYLSSSLRFGSQCSVNRVVGFI